MEPKIKQERITDDVIFLMTDRGAICELSTFAMDRQKELLLDHGIKCPYPLFFFHRIRSMEEGKGHGTALMKRLIEICDEKGFAIINPINPYGRMDLEELKVWFGKYGFIEVEDSLVIRLPKEKK